LLSECKAVGSVTEDFVAAVADCFAPAQCSVAEDFAAAQCSVAEDFVAAKCSVAEDCSATEEDPITLEWFEVEADSTVED